MNFLVTFNWKDLSGGDMISLICPEKAWVSFILCQICFVHNSQIIITLNISL